MGKGNPLSLLVDNLAGRPVFPFNPEGLRLYFHTISTLLFLELGD
jgi:hypothetical protein